MSKHPKAAKRANAAWGAGPSKPRHKAPRPGQVLVGTPETMGLPVGAYVATDPPERGKRATGPLLERVVDIPQRGKLGELRPAYRDEVTESWRPRPADVVDLRAGLVTAWRPGGQLERISSILLQPGACGPPAWERSCLAEAALWYVSAPMCDLLEGAAPAMPALELTAELMPDKVGFVVFQRCLEGIDADGSDAPVTVGAMLWGPAWWRWGPEAEEQPVVGITVYRPVPLVGPPMTPIGSLVWPLGMSPDAALTAEAAKDASMAEDRRRLAALWVLSGQRELVTQTEAPLPRQVLRRASRAGLEPPKVRVVHLRAPLPERGPEGPGGASGRHLHHRFIVAGHWRNQACGKGRADRRPTWIAAYPKGPEGAPLLRRSTVKAWDR